MTDDYPFEKKKLLATKISQMSNKDNLKKIKKIIIDNNDSVKETKNSYGCLMYFHNYSNETYLKIEELITQIEKETLERINSVTSCLSENILSSDVLSDDDTDATPKMKYTNKEKRLIKRQKYETVISKTNNEQNKN
jgi:hypothetical protein|uniref:NET domain-containing protein n=1 Tax=viral metagenome TaxID=1070528 RepID=A0A6C0DY89_9ZZZZ